MKAQRLEHTCFCNRRALRARLVLSVLTFACFFWIFLATAAGQTLTATPISISPGGTLTATWSGIADPTRRDWIGLYVPGTADTVYVDRIYLSCSNKPGSGQASGSCPFVLPASLATGTYELRLLANNDFTRLATSNAFSVEYSARLSASPTIIAPGETLTATWSGIADPTRRDWIGLYVPGTAETAYIAKIYLSCSEKPGSPRPSGSCPFPLPASLALGTYELRLLANNGFTRLATSNTFSVSVAPSITSLSPASGPVGTSVTITGSNFGATQGTSTLTFNGTTATPSNWSATSIVAPVPAGSTTGPVIVTVGGTASNAVTFTVTTKLAITSVNGGGNPTAGVGFPVVVQSQDANGTPANVASATVVSLSLTTGSGTLGGTLTGTIAAGSNQVTISGVTYTKAESGVVITATRTSGDLLPPADSSPFTVNSGAAAKLAFTTQPGNSNVGSPIPGPPTVTVQDSFNNTVTSSTASITVAIGSNPGGGTLSGTTTKNASSGIASFSDLSINQPGNGYTLNASSTGLTGATSNGFNVTTFTGGAIAGVVLRASDGLPISGASVEAYQGSFLMGSATTNPLGDYSIAGLLDGSYTVRATFTGFVPQIRTGVTITDSRTAFANLNLNVGIAIHSPVAGAVISDHSVLVTGMFDNSLGEVGVNVNGYVALQNGNEFATVVPLDEQTTSLTATVTNTSGTELASHTIPITIQPPTTEPVLTFRPFPAIALVSQPVSFTLTSLNEISQIELDGNGDGTTDFTGTSLDGVTVTFAEPGIYFPTVRVTDTASAVHTDSAIVQVVNDVQLNALLKAKWEAMKNALRSGNTVTAASYIVISKRTSYETVFNNLTIPFSSIDQMLGNITYQATKGLEVEYEMLMDDGPDGIVSYMVLFSLDVDGVWRISFF